MAEKMDENNRSVSKQLENVSKAINNIASGINQSKIESEKMYMMQRK